MARTSHIPLTVPVRHTTKTHVAFTEGTARTRIHACTTYTSLVHIQTDTHTHTDRHTDTCRQTHTYTHIHTDMQTRIEEVKANERGGVYAVKCQRQ